MAELIYSAITSLDGYIEDEAGKPSLPGDVRLRLELRDVRRFDNGTVYLDYGART